MGTILSEDQQTAIKHLKNGSILCGGVGSGKSRTALGYYLFRVCQGSVKINGEGHCQNMEYPRDLYIITTAKKRDSQEWDDECRDFLLFRNDPRNSLSRVTVKIDSWNNIKKYKDVYGAFFIFDEQRLVGRGSWVKTFLNIARKNQWILLTATPADSYSDLIPIFVANGFFKNRTEFNQNHVVFSPYSKYPKIERYLGTKKLDAMRDSILVELKDRRLTKRYNKYVRVDFNRELYRTVFIDRWDPYENKPIEEMGKLLYLLRKVCYSDPSRLEALTQIVEEKKACIVFYNFSYELEMLRECCRRNRWKWREWNGEKHEGLPKGDQWLYLVQYSAGCEGWNCITTDTVVLFSQTYSYRMLEQARGRIDRMNTPFINLYYYHLISSSSIDIAIRACLRRKRNFNERSFIRR